MKKKTERKIPHIIIVICIFSRLAIKMCVKENMRKMCVETNTIINQSTMNKVEREESMGDLRIRYVFGRKRKKEKLKSIMWKIQIHFHFNYIVCRFPCLLRGGHASILSTCYELKSQACHKNHKYYEIIYQKFSKRFNASYA